MKISEIHKSAREMFDVPESSTTRLVNYHNKHPSFKYDDDKYLENYPVLAKENKILLDYKKMDSTWFSDELKEIEQTAPPPITTTTLLPTHSLFPSNNNNNNDNNNNNNDNNNNDNDNFNNFNNFGFNYNSSFNYISSENAEPGIVGFRNFGNTCFFNSGTQCLLHTVPLVMKFVCSDEWMNDLNYTNKIGMKGELANLETIQGWQNYILKCQGKMKISK